MAALPDELWSKLLQELLARLPLSLITANNRLNALDNSAAADCCLRSCNLVFEILVSQIKQLRHLPDFQTFWLRYTSILATNANLLTRGLAIHEEMLEMIAAIMRLLRPPALPAAPPVAPRGSASSTGSSVSSSKPQASHGGGSSILGLFSLWGSSASEEDATEAVPLVGAPDTVTTTSVVGGGGNDGAAAGESITLVDDDGSLLTLSWKTMCSLYPSLQANLRLKNPQLVGDLIKYAEIQEKRDAALALAQAAGGSENVLTERGLGAVVDPGAHTVGQGHDTRAAGAGVAVGISTVAQGRAQAPNESTSILAVPDSSKSDVVSIRSPNIRTIDARTHVV